MPLSSIEAALDDVLADFAGIEPGPGERRLARWWLRCAGRCNRALVAPGEAPGAEAYRAWVALRTRQALARVITGWAHELGRPTDARRLVQSRAVATATPPDAALGGLLAPAEVVDRIDVNTASVAALAARPGFGPTTARRLAASRREAGPFATVDDLRERRILSAEALERARPWIRAWRPAGAFAFVHPALAAFVAEPGPATLAGLLRDTGGEWPPFDDAGAPGTTPARRLLRTLERAAQELEAEANPHPLVRVRAADVDAWFARRSAVAAMEAEAVAARGASMAKGARYATLARQLLDSAQGSVRLVMFFARYLADEPDHPANALVEAVAAAHARGVDVRVLFDLDAEGGVAGSRIVNEGAFALLRARGVPVRHDSVEVTTHSKALAVDGRHVLLGSHNWTAGSIYAYDDMSLYFDSTALAALVGIRFEALWAEAEED